MMILTMRLLHLSRLIHKFPETKVVESYRQ